MAGKRRKTATVQAGTEENTPPCPKCGCATPRIVGNYVSCCYTLIYCPACGFKVMAHGRSVKGSIDRCQQKWLEKDESPAWEDEGWGDFNLGAGLLEED